MVFRDASCTWHVVGDFGARWFSCDILLSWIRSGLWLQISNSFHFEFDWDKLFILRFPPISVSEREIEQLYSLMFKVVVQVSKQKKTGLSRIICLSNVQQLIIVKKKWNWNPKTELQRVQQDDEIVNECYNHLPNQFYFTSVSAELEQAHAFDYSVLDKAAIRFSVIITAKRRMSGSCRILFSPPMNLKQQFCFFMWKMFNWGGIVTLITHRFSMIVGWHATG